jgi:hypothetical protein
MYAKSWLMFDSKDKEDLYTEMKGVTELFMLIQLSEEEKDSYINE